jgi:hypothetical protein
MITAWLEIRFKPLGSQGKRTLYLLSSLDRNDEVGLLMSEIREACKTDYRIDDQVAINIRRPSRD